MLPTDDPRVLSGGAHGFNRGPKHAPSSNTNMLMVANGITGAITEVIFHFSNKFTTRTVSQNLVSTFISTNESTNMSILSSSAPSKNDIQIIGSGLDYFGQVVLQLQTNPEIRFCIKV